MSCINALAEQLRLKTPARAFQPVPLGKWRWAFSSARAEHLHGTRDYDHLSCANFTKDVHARSNSRCKDFLTRFRSFRALRVREARQNLRQAWVRAKVAHARLRRPRPCILTAYCALPVPREFLGKVKTGETPARAISDVQDDALSCSRTGNAAWQSHDAQERRSVTITWCDISVERDPSLGGPGLFNPHAAHAANIV